MTTHLLRCRDDELRVLKGHIILEVLLRDFIHSHRIVPDPLDRKRLMFGQTLHVAMSLPSAKLLADDYRHLSEINQFRNRLAHEHPYKTFDSDLESWAIAVLGRRLRTAGSRRGRRKHIVDAFERLAVSITAATASVRDSAARVDEAPG